MSGERVVVAGAGIGGLAVAIALRQQGFSPIVCERDDDSRGKLGSGITIWTNALAALDRIGLADAVVAAGTPLDYQRLHDQDGVELGAVPVGEIGKSLGRAGIGIRRRELLRVLAEAADVEIRYRCAVEDVRQDDGAVTVSTSDGARLSGVALIGADGLRSRVRAVTVGDGPPTPECHMIWRGISDSHDGFPPRTSYMVYGPAGTRAVSWPVAEDAVCWSVSLNGPPWHGGRDGEDDPQRLKESLLRMFSRLPSPIVSIMTNTPAQRLMRTDLFARPAENDWVFGRIALLGDAAHAMPTTYGQGACQALEDAVVCAESLAEHRDDPARGLALYERRRQPRVRWIRERVFQLSRYQGWEHPFLVRSRDHTLRTLPPAASLGTWRRLLDFDPTGQFS